MKGPEGTTGPGKVVRLLHITIMIAFGVERHGHTGFSPLLLLFFCFLLAFNQPDRMEDTVTERWTVAKLLSANPVIPKSEL